MKKEQAQSAHYRASLDRMRGIITKFTEDDALEVIHEVVGRDAETARAVWTELLESRQVEEADVTTPELYRVR